MKRNLIKEYYDYLGKMEANPTRPMGRYNPLMRTWLYCEIDGIIENRQFDDLKEFIIYFDICRTDIIELFDYVMSEEVSQTSIDWRIGDNELVNFLMSNFMVCEKHQFPNKYCITNLVIDKILAHHMLDFVSLYKWDYWVHPTIPMIYDIYRSFNRFKHVKENDEDCFDGELWEWVLLYGEHSALPFRIIMAALTDASKSNSPETIAMYITPAFLNHQTLVDSTGDDGYLSTIWDMVMTSSAAVGVYPDELANYYLTEAESEKCDAILLYNKIYKKLCKLHKERISAIKKLIEGCEDGKMFNRLKPGDDFFILSYYRALYHNCLIKNSELPVMDICLY